MDIASVSPAAGLAATGSAIQKAQERFSDAAEAVVADTLEDGSGAVDGTALVQDAVSMQSESLMNQVLFSVFARQADQQKSLVDMINPTSR